MKYIKQLDSLRTIAVMLVMASHWLPPFINIIPNGRLGVDIFFVLSGFLITWILLDNRNRTDSQHSGKGTVIRNFYIRRTLRIFPIYYVVVFLLLAFAAYTGTDIATSYPYYLTYTSNFHIFEVGNWETHGILSHLWSLAVEEQFYLLWPALVLFIPRRLLLWLIIALIAIGVGSEFLLRNDPMGLIITPACFHAFGLGALLAWYIVYYPDGIEQFYRGVKIVAAAAIILLVLGFVQPETGIYRMFRCISAPIGIFLITHLVHRSSTNALKLSFIWNNPILIFLGKISYGMYLFHNILPFFTAKLLVKLGISVPDMLPFKLGYPAMIAINFGLVVLVSWISWICIEKPILRLKKLFEYNGKHRNQEPVVLEAGN